MGNKSASGRSKKQVSEPDSAGDVPAVFLTTLVGSQLQVLVHSAVFVAVESRARRALVNRKVQQESSA